MFGGDVSFETFYDSLQALLEKAPAMTPVKARLLMTEEYQRQFNIDSNNNPDRPLSLVAMHDAEDPITGSLLEERLKEFADLDLRRIFGISVMEFLDMPHNTCEMMVEIARPRRHAENAALEKSMRELGKGVARVPGM